MATVAFAPTLTRRISLAQIDVAVSARLGPTRIPGNAQPACFNRQIAMYLARHVGHWSTTVIGRFYNGRDHSTVCHSIQRIEALRETDSEVDALLAHLKHQILETDAVRETEHHAGPGCIEPDAYITDLDGGILLAQGDAGNEICVGTISAHSVHLDEANEHGVPWFDVLDARSADTGNAHRSL